MIISHRYRYVFVQNPRTASTSMGVELCRNYHGEYILWKHARYNDFLKTASEDERRYFAFTGQRNPLDALVTIYFRSKYQNLKRVMAKKDSTGKEMAIKRQQIERWKYISENDLSFVQFFNRYHGNTLDRSHLKLELENMNFIYRYEHLQRDFSAALSAMGVEQKRELPQHSKKTKHKESDFYSYFTPGIRRRAKIIFGGSCKAMGYPFPVDWPEPGFLDYAMFYKDHILNRFIQAVSRRIRSGAPTGGNQSRS